MDVASSFSLSRFNYSAKDLEAELQQSSDLLVAM
jgi:hypothetical protein